MHSYHLFSLSRIGMKPFIVFLFRLLYSLSGYKTDKSFYFKLKSNATKMFAAKIGRWIIFRQIHWNMVAMQTTWKQSQIKFSTDWFQKFLSPTLAILKIMLFFLSLFYSLSLFFSPVLWSKGILLSFLFCQVPCGLANDIISLIFHTNERLSMHYLFVYLASGLLLKYPP